MAEYQNGYPNGNGYANGNGAPAAPPPNVALPHGATRGTPTLGQLANPRSVAIHAPTAHTQLNPIIQPLALVPYNTMSQPLYQIVEE